MTDMNLNKLFLVSIIISLISATSCRKSVLENPTTNHSSIHGNWQWVQSSGGIAGQTTTPFTEGREATLQFNQNGTCFFVTGNKSDQFEYSLSDGQTIYSEKQAHLITYKAIDNKTTHVIQSYQFRGNDTLFLNDECHDCFGHIYVRKR
jgi:hypothetical protein